MRRLVMSGLVGLAAVLGGTGLTAAGSAPAAARVMATSQPQAAAAATDTFNSTGSRISCGAPHACLAIGSSIIGTADATPTVEAWNGTAWRSVTVAVPAGGYPAQLNDVSCSSAASCLVVGSYQTYPGTELPYALSWNGTSLTPTATPPTVRGDEYVALDAVSCVTAGACVSVGTSAGNSLPAFKIVAETWNGASWTLRTARNPGGALIAQPAGIRCFTVTSCVAAGTSLLGSDTQKMLLVRWNGEAFTAMKATAPAGGYDLLLGDVSCASAKRCVAAGFSTNRAGTRELGFTEVWNGTEWAAHKVTWPASDTDATLAGVSCATPTSCIAVGGAGPAKGGAAKALSFNGTTWSQQNVPGPGKGKSSGFADVSCPKADDCVAIGSLGATGGDASRPLAGRWNGTSWKVGLA